MPFEMPSEDDLWAALKLLDQALERYLPADLAATRLFPWEVTSLYVAMQHLMVLALESSQLSTRAYQQQACQIVQSLRAVLRTEESQRLAALLHIEQTGS